MLQTGNGRVWTINTDGSAPKNGKEDSPTGVGAVIKCDGIEVARLAAFTGQGSVNTAEFTAILFGLRMLTAVYGYKELDLDTVEIVGDSEVAIKTLRGEYENRYFKDVVAAIWLELSYLLNLQKSKVTQFQTSTDFAWAGRVVFKYVPRLENKEADGLSGLYTR